MMSYSHEDGTSAPSAGNFVAELMQLRTPSMVASALGQARLVNLLEDTWK